MSLSPRLALPLLLTIAVARSGHPQAHHLRPGIIAGVVFASWRGSDAGSDLRYRTGLQGGGTLSLDLNSSVALQTGVMYSQEGVSSDLGGGASIAVKMDYLRLPVYLRLGPPRMGTGQLRPYLLGGPALGFRVRCRLEASDGSTSTSTGCDDPALGLDFRDIEVSAHLGVGVELGRFEIYGRYGLGLGSIVRVVATGPSGGGGGPTPPPARSVPARLNTVAASGPGLDVKNKGFAIGLGFEF